MKNLFSIIFLLLFSIFGQQNVYGQILDTTGQAQKKDSINKNNDSLNTNQRMQVTSELENKTYINKEKISEKTYET